MGSTLLHMNGNLMQYGAQNTPIQHFQVRITFLNPMDWTAFTKLAHFKCI